MSVQLVSTKIRDDHIARRHHSLADIGRRRQDAAGIEPNRDISVSGGDVSALVNPSPNRADIAPVLVFRLQCAGRN